MDKCAYCGSTKNKISKEHVISKSFLSEKYLEGIGYANHYEDYTKNYLTIKDVCVECNNGVLSILDNYFLEFCKKMGQSLYVNDSTEVVLEYNYDKLARWLLKTLYNSERKNGYAYMPKEMHKFKNYILGKDKRDKLFKIYVELLSDIPDDVMEKNFNNNIKKVDYFKLGNVMLSNEINDENRMIVKYILSGNVVFYIFILNKKNKSHEKFMKKLNEYKEVSNIRNFYLLDSKTSMLKLSTSGRTILSYIEATYEGNQHAVDRFFNTK